MTDFTKTIEETEFPSRKSRPYRIWTHLKRRCNDKNHKAYGGRGISYDPNWNEFKSFWEDMRDGYADTLTIDRIDCDGNYTKENCRWATSVQQNRNRTNNLVFNGETAAEASLRITGGYYEKLVSNRISYNGWSVEKAFNTPLTRKRNRAGLPYEKKLLSN
jgi:hypothetical protein